jgi:hypothetical protein
MGRARFRSLKWLGSSAAVKAHLVFTCLFVLLGWAYFDGNQGAPDDLLWGIVFCGIAYPLVLALTYLQWRTNGRSSER